MNLHSGEKQFDIIGLGEAMLRLSPSGPGRLSQSGALDKFAGGSEMNVVAGAAQLGRSTALVTKLPDNPLGRFLQSGLRACGISDRWMIFDPSPEKRVGIYFYEYGAHPRKPAVTYDRRGSSFSSLASDEVDEGIFTQTCVFHTSGITLALGEKPRETALRMIRLFKQGGALVSFDVNYRANLWDEDTARETIRSVLPFIDLLFVSEETSRRMMARTGTLEEMMRGYCEEFGVKLVASTSRTVQSPKCHSFNSTIYCHEERRAYTGRAYENIDVVDRIGSGDAYVAGVLSGLLLSGSVQTALDYGNAMSALKNTVAGDLPATHLEEIQRMVKQHSTRRDAGEMDR